MSTPSGFEQRRLKYAATINDEALAEDTDPDFELQYVDIGNVDSCGSVQGIAAYRFADAPSRARRQVRDGDVIISTVRTYLQAIAAIQQPPDNLIVSTGFAVIRPRASVFHAGFSKYALREAAFLAEVEMRSAGVSYPAINAFDLGAIPIHLPTLQHQRAVADYLDRETARLDGLVAAKEHLLGLLAEKRRALITRAVTRGLDGYGVSRSASHTKVRLKYRAHVEMGQSPPSAEYSLSSDEGLPFLQGTADFGPQFPVPRVYCGSPTKVAAKGDLLFSVRAPVGELNVADQEVGIGRGLCGIRPGAIWFPRFGWWALHEARHQLNYVSTGSTYEAVATEDVANMPVEHAALDEQRAIADYLDRETAKLDALRSATERTIALLKERRAALIAAAVTGAIDAREAVS